MEDEGPTSEVELMREMMRSQVEAMHNLAIELNAERAAMQQERIFMQQERMPWQGGPEGGGNAPPLETPEVQATPARPVPPQQFRVSSDSGAPDWQDPWTQSADPWNASWRQQDGQGGWGNAAPPNPPPGLAPAAFSEQ